MAKFDELAIELIMDIVEIARRRHHKPIPWLASLAITSRTMHAAATPILYKTVYITRRNFGSIVAMCRVRWYLQDLYPPPWDQVNHAVSSLSRKLVRGMVSTLGKTRTTEVEWDRLPTRYTRRLVLLDADPRLDTVAPAFQHVTAFAGTSRQVKELSIGSHGRFMPEILSLTDPYSHQTLEYLPILPQATHLHLCIPLWDKKWPLPPFGRRTPAVTHIMVHYHNMSDWSDNIVALTQHILEIPTLTRLLLCLIPNDDNNLYWMRMMQQLTELAHSREDTRLYVVFSEDKPGRLREWCPCHPWLQDMSSALNRDRWLNGRALYA